MCRIGVLTLIFGLCCSCLLLFIPWVKGLQLLSPGSTCPGEKAKFLCSVSDVTSGQQRTTWRIGGNVSTTCQIALDEPNTSIICGPGQVTFESMDGNNFTTAFTITGALELNGTSIECFFGSGVLAYLNVIDFPQPQYGFTYDCTPPPTIIFFNSEENIDNLVEFTNASITVSYSVSGGGLSQLLPLSMANTTITLPQDADIIDQNTTFTITFQSSQCSSNTSWSVTIFNIVSLKGIRIDPNSVTVHVDFTYNGCHENPSVLSLRLTYASSVEPDSECGPDPALLCNLIDCSSQLGSQLSMMLLSGSSKCPLKSGTTYSLTLTTMEDRTVTGLPMSRNFTTAGCPATKIIALGNSVEVVTVDALDMAVEGQIDSIAYLPGYTVQFHCSDSQLYTLAGPKSWTCSTQGQWEPSDQEPQCLINKAAVSGISVGIFLGVLFICPIILLVVFIVKKRSHKNSSKEPEIVPNASYGQVNLTAVLSVDEKLQIVPNTSYGQVNMTAKLTGVPARPIDVEYEDVNPVQQGTIEDKTYEEVL